MDKFNEKGKIRNRYAKLQPLVNRINEYQNPDPVSKYHRAKPHNEHGINSYGHQLQNDFRNLVLANNNSMEIKVIEKPVDVELQNFKMPMVLFDKSIVSSARDAETVRKQKKHKHKNKEKLYRTSFLDLGAELLDILNCFLYIMWSPIVFFARFFLTLASSSASALHNMVKLLAPRCTSMSQEEEALRSEERKLEILNSFTAKSREAKQPSDLNKFLTKQSSDFNPGGCFVSQGVKRGAANDRARTEDGKNQKESLRKKFNLSLEMVDEMCGNLGIEGGNYFQYSSRYQDISSVELSSDCLSAKYSSRFLDNKDCRKRVSRQYQRSVSASGKTTSISTLRNSSFRGSRTAVNSKRSNAHSKNLSRRNEQRALVKNVSLSDASEFSENQIERIDKKNRSQVCDKHTEEKLRAAERNSTRVETEGKLNGHVKSSATLLTNLRKKRTEKYRPHAPFPPLPLRPTLHKKSSSEDERQADGMTRDCNYTLFNNLRINLAIPGSQNRNSQPVLDPNPQITRKLESCKKTDKDSYQRKELKTTISSGRYNTQRLVSERDAESSSFQCKPHFCELRKEMTVSGDLKNVCNSNDAAQRDERKEQTKISEAASLGGADENLPQFEKHGQGFEGEERINGSEDREEARKREKLRTAEFTKPIDAKSKWLEMKKKFYGKDYAAEKEQPEKLEADNLSSITSVSKLPAQKIFQYNMLVGRARQMGEELPSAANILLERKTTSPCLKTLGNSDLGSKQRRNEAQYSQSVIPTSRRLSQTQSLSQWPLGACNPSRSKKFCSLEEKPKPTPRTDGISNLCKIQGDARTPTLSRGFAQSPFPQRPATCTNSSVSSTALKRNEALQNGAKLVDWPLQVKNLSMKNANLSDDYAEQINSLVSFCRSPPSVPRESNDREFKRADQADNEFLGEAAAGDSS